MKVGAARRVLAFLPPRERVRGADAPEAPLSPATVVGYGGIDGSQRPCSAGEAPLSLLSNASAVDLLFDVSDVFTGIFDVPAMSDGRLRQALPGLVEERLLTDAGDCQLAYRIEGAERSLTQVAVAAIDRSALTWALEAAADAGVRPCRAYSALYSIPVPTAGTLSLRISRGRGTVRTAEHAGFAFALDQGAPAALSIAVQQLDIKRVRVYGRDARKLLPLLGPLHVDVVKPKRDFDATSVDRAVNLLQGRFAGAGRFGMPAIRSAAAAAVVSGQLKPLLVWAGVGLAIGVIGLNAVRFRLEADIRALHATMQTAFRDAFPAEPAIEPVTQTQRHLRELRSRAGEPSPDDFSELNAQAAQLLSNAPVGSLAEVEYRDAALTLKFKPAAASSAAFQNALQAQASQQGLSVHFASDNVARIVPAAP